MKRIIGILLLMCVVQPALCGCSNQSEPSLSSTASQTQTEEPVGISSSQPADETIEETYECISFTFPEYGEYLSSGIECSPIDKSLDCEGILLEKSDRLKTLMTDYLNLDEEKLVYGFGKRYVNENGFADRSLITNEKVKPKFQSISEEGSCQTEGAETVEQSDLNSVPWKYLEGENPTEIVSVIQSAALMNCNWY